MFTLMLFVLIIGFVLGMSVWCIGYVIGRLFDIMNLKDSSIDD